METSRTATDMSRTIHRIQFAVDWPPGHVSAYLIDGEEPILVDSGMPGTEATTELVDGLAAVNRSLSDIEHFVLTHPHVDHIGQVSTLLERSDPIVYAPVRVRNRLTRSPSELQSVVEQNAAVAGLQGTAREEVVNKSVDSLKRNQSLFDVTEVDHWIEHEQHFEVGGCRLAAIHTPGHQADHLSYTTTIGDEQVLFSGDLLLEPFRSVMIHTGLDAGVEHAVEAFYTALDRLEQTEATQVFPGHGPPHRTRVETVERSRNSIGRMLEHARRRAVEGPVTPLEIATDRAGEREIHYVLPEVVSSLAHLESIGKIDRTVTDGVHTYHAPGN